MLLNAVKEIQISMFLVKVIFCGDFYQLPPVKQYSDSSNTFAFKASCWDKTVDKVFLLRTPFRQKDKGNVFYICFIVNLWLVIVCRIR